MIENKKLLEVAIEIQKDCHLSTDQMMANSSKHVVLQDAINVFIYRKLAEMEIRLRAIESNESFYKTT
jgi:hypothetical protein